MQDAKEFSLQDLIEESIRTFNPCGGAPCNACGGPPPKCAPLPKPPSKCRFEQ